MVELNNPASAGTHGHGTHSSIGPHDHHQRATVHDTSGGAQDARIETGTISGPVSYVAGGFTIDLSARFASLLFVGLELEDRGIQGEEGMWAGSRWEVTRLTGADAGKFKVKVYRPTYERLSAIGDVSGQPAGVTVQTASGAKVAQESAHTHAINHDHASVVSGNASADTATSVDPTGSGSAVNSIHKHTVDLPSHVASSGAGAAHDHTDDNLYQHQHARTTSQTSLTEAEIAGNADLSTVSWRYLAVGAPA